MYVVYWTETKDGIRAPHMREFDTAAMGDAMKWMEALRNRRAQGEAIAFVALASEHPDSVGLPGVAEAGPDYRWKKRRP